MADDARAEALRAIARDLVQAKIDPDTARGMLEKAAAASPEHFTKMQALIAGLVTGDEQVKAPARASSAGPSETVAQYAERWFDDRERRGLSSVSTDRGRLEKHVMPLLGSSRSRLWARTTVSVRPTPS